MSGIHIPGIELPKGRPGAFKLLVMYVGADGKIRAECEGTHKVIVVPDHGRTIDADALRAEVQKHATPSDTWVFSLIRTAPTVIPADPAEEGEK